MRRGVCLALLGLAVVCRPPRRRKPKASAAEPPKVLVVTSTEDALTTRGPGRDQRGVGGRRVHRHGARAG